ncbi:MAG: hypothetical protein V4581_04855 [Bacteroidota bacterium]
MKRFLLLLLAFPTCLMAQEEYYSMDNVIQFILKNDPDTIADFNGIDWAEENIIKEFELKGPVKLRYALHPVNDTVMQLLQPDGKKWKVQETINHSGWMLTRITDGIVYPYIQAIDFDKDGDEDLMLWVNMNMNGNMWTIIYLNDQKQQKLVQLVNTTTPQGNGIWDDPKYDPQTGQIHTELYSGVYGIQNTATYKLVGTTALPVIKNETDLTNSEKITYTSYKGNDGQWVPYEITTDLAIDNEDKDEPNGFVALEKERYIMFEFEDIFTESGDLDFKNQEIKADFIVEGKKPLYYKIVMQDEATALLMQRVNSEWIKQETFMCDTSGWEMRGGWPLVSSFKIEDFDKDDNQDLVYYEMGGGHNTLICTFFINNPKTGRLAKLYDTAEDTDFFVNPEYDAKSKTLSTSVSGGMYYSSSSTYKIENGKVIPFTKTELKDTDDGQTTETTYKGKNGQWKQVKSKVIKS